MTGAESIDHLEVFGGFALIDDLEGRGWPEEIMSALRSLDELDLIKELDGDESFSEVIDENVAQLNAFVERIERDCRLEGGSVLKRILYAWN